MFHPLKQNISPPTYPNHMILVSLETLNFLIPMILKSHDLDKWIAKYFVTKDKTYRDTEKRRKDTEKCTIQYLFSMSLSFPYHFSIFSVSEFFIGHLEMLITYILVEL